MTETREPTEARVAVYLDFDNVVISRYDQLHGRESWRRDEARAIGAAEQKLEKARVDFGAILDYASSFGTIALTRAYADWSVPANAAYRRQLVDRAIDLTQLFPASSTKNGADIRLAVDVVDDMFRLPDITHVVIVAGDSDYIPLVQRCKRLGRVVVGIGVTGSTSSALVAALDEFAYYDTLLSPEDADDDPDDAVEEAPAATAAEPDPAPEPGDDAGPTKLSPAAAGRLLVRALDLGRAQGDDDEWFNASSVKSQMKRLNPLFNEKDLGFKSFQEFVRSRKSQVEMREEGQQRFLRIRPAKASRPAREPRRAARPAGAHTGETA